MTTATCLDRPLFEVLPELERQPFKVLLDEVFRTGDAVLRQGGAARGSGAATGRSKRVFLNFVYQPRRSVKGEVEGILVIAFDVTDEVKRARRS